LIIVVFVKFSFKQLPCIVCIGMYRILLFQIWPEPDLAGFVNSNPAGARFDNLDQHKTTPLLQ